MIPSEILDKVKQIEIRTRSVVNDILSGEYHSIFKGSGMEFSEVRTYAEGDDIRNIDWNVTARARELFVKKHIEERELTVMLVVDASASGNFGTVNKFKSEMAVEMCALLAFSAIKNNDRVGLIIFTSEVELFIPPKKGKNHVLRVIRELLYFKPEKKGTNINEAIEYLRKVQKKKAVVFFLSDFISKDYQVKFSTASKHYDMIAVPFSDPAENILNNAGMIELNDPETGHNILVDTSDKKFRDIFSKRAKKRKMSLDQFFKSSGIDSIEVSTAGDYVDAIVKFFKKREKRLS